jgi:cystathionine beta-lyase/cystathionine gamma-synthase
MASDPAARGENTRAVHLPTPPPLTQVATSLGGTHTKVSHVASTTHRQFDDAALAAASIDPGAIRFPVGLGDAADLIADATQALDALGRTREELG